MLADEFTMTIHPYFVMTPIFTEIHSVNYPLHVRSTRKKNLEEATRLRNKTRKSHAIPNAVISTTQHVQAVPCVRELVL